MNVCRRSSRSPSSNLIFSTPTLSPLSEYRGQQSRVDLNGVICIPVRSSKSNSRARLRATEVVVQPILRSQSTLQRRAPCPSATPPRSRVLTSSYSHFDRSPSPAYHYEELRLPSPQCVPQSRLSRDNCIQYEDSSEGTMSHASTRRLTEPRLRRLMIQRDAGAQTSESPALSGKIVVQINKRRRVMRGAKYQCEGKSQVAMSAVRIHLISEKQGRLSVTPSKSEACKDHCVY